MGIVCGRVFVVIRNAQPCADALRQDRRKTGSTTASAFNIVSIRVGCSHFFTMAGRAAHLPFLHYHIFGLQKQDCMNFSVQVKVMPLKELLDPQGKAVLGGLQNLGIKTVQDVRIGKIIRGIFVKTRDGHAGTCIHGNDAGSPRVFEAGAS